MSRFFDEKYVIITDDRILITENERDLEKFGIMKEDMQRVGSQYFIDIREKREVLEDRKILENVMKRIFKQRDYDVFILLGVIINIFITLVR